MSLIDQQPRSADVIAGSNGARGFALNADGWVKLMNSNHSELKATVLNNYLKYQQTAFRNTNQLGLKEARSRLKLEKQRVISAHFFAQMVVGLISFIFLLGFVTDVFKQTESTFVSFGLLLAYSIWSFLFIKHSKIPVEEFGITLENFKPAIKLIGPATIIFIISLFLLKWILISFWPESFGDKLIDFYLLDEHTWSYALLVLTVYSFHAALQEFIARSCIQGGLMQFVVGKWAEWKAIILATLMFGSFHIMIDVRYGFLTLIPGFFWGYFFYRQKNLLAISISHIIIGITALFLLNLMG
jgi:membrane protease YdiL (CAAX protease family)